jgi:hypothetical protein
MGVLEEDEQPGGKMNAIHIESHGGLEVFRPMTLPDARPGHPRPMPAATSRPISPAKDVKRNISARPRAPAIRATGT